MSILSTSSKLVRVGDSYSAGEGISIENNTISVTGDYGHAYSAGDNITISDDNIISSKDWSSDIAAASANSYNETTAWVDGQGFITDADLGDYALKTDVETTSGLLKLDIDEVSGSVSSKLDTTTFTTWQNGQYSNDIGGLANNIDTVSGAVDAISGVVSGLDIPTHQEIIDASGYAYSQSTAWTDSQGYLTEHQPISAAEWNESYETVLANSAQWSENTGDEDVNNAVYNNSAKWNDIEVYQTNSSTYLTAHQDISNKLDTTAFSTVSGTFLTAHQSLDGYLTKTSADTLYQPIGNYASENDLEQVSGALKNDIDYISGVAITAHQDLSNYATTGDLNTASSYLSGAIDYVSANAGTSIDTITVAVISPLVTGFSGESAYLGIESTALNLSSYVPVSSIGVNSQGYVSGISGMEISARNALTAMTANYATNAGYASRANQDSNYNTITSYYQPKLTIAGSAGSITSINGSAVGASIPEGWELVAGEGIEIVDDAGNNQTTISVTAQGGDPEVESVVKSNSSTWNEISVYETNSASYLTAHQSLDGYLTKSSADTLYQPVGSYASQTDLEQVSGDLKGDIDYISGVAITAHQDISNKLDATAFSTVSGTFLTGINIPESATWNDVASVYQSNSSTYLTAETDWTNTITAASSYAYNEAVAQIPAPFDPTYMSGAIDYISGVAITALPGDLATTGDVNDLAQSISETYQVKGDYLTTADSGNFYPMTGNPSGFLTSHQDISNKLDTTAFSDVSGAFLTAVNIPESANWNDATTAYQTNSATYMTEPNLEYNAVNEISAYNGSAIAQYGAEKQWLVHDDTLVHASNSAQFALGVNLSAVAQLLGVDETVLYSGNRTQSAVLSDSIWNYNRIGIYAGANGQNISNYQIFDTVDISSNGNTIMLQNTFNFEGTAYYSFVNNYSALYNGTTLYSVGADGIAVDTAVTTYKDNKNLGCIKKVIGIGRKN